jgi:hypothetical protein
MNAIMASILTGPHRLLLPSKIYEGGNPVPGIALKPGNRALLLIKF